MRPHKILLLGSILLSILAHIAEIHFFQKQSLWFSTQASSKNRGILTASIEKKEKSEILKETFLSVGTNKTLKRNSKETLRKTPSTQDLNNLAFYSASNLFFTPRFDPKQDFTKQDFPSHFPKIPLIASHLKEGIKNFPLEETALLPPLPKEPFIPSPLNNPPITELSPHPLATEFSLKEKDLESLNQNSVSTMRKSREDFAAAIDGHSVPSKMEITTLPILPKIPSLSDLQTVSHSPFFDTELTFHNQEDGSYIFALTLIPRSDLKLTPLKQNYIFLIDRSNSIQGERLTATKSAVRKALEEMHENDRFNIVAFDQKIDKLAPSFLASSSESISKAQKFLNKIELGSFFSQSNLSKPLFLTIPFQPSEDEVYTAILITDGESLSQKHAAQDLMEDWTRMNQGKVVLYTLGMNEDGHSHELDTLSALNRGKNFSSPTRRGLKRKLLKIMKSIHTPIAKNLNCKAISLSPHTEVELSPQDNLLNLLYQNEPYVILGKVSQLEDFTIFVQGRLNGERLHIKKNISFAHAKKGSDALLTEWAQQKAYSLYQNYLYSQDHRFLAEAQNLLNTHGLENLSQKFMR